jgi:hypothetical protein
MRTDARKSSRRNGIESGRLTACRVPSHRIIRPMTS